MFSTVDYLLGDYLIVHHIWNSLRQDISAWCYLSFGILCLRNISVSQPDGTGGDARMNHWCTSASVKNCTPVSHCTFSGLHWRWHHFHQITWLETSGWFCETGTWEAAENRLDTLDLCNWSEAKRENGCSVGQKHYLKPHVTTQEFKFLIELMWGD